MEIIPIIDMSQSEILQRVTESLQGDLPIKVTYRNTSKRIRKLLLAIEVIDKERFIAVCERINPRYYSKIYFKDIRKVRVEKDENFSWGSWSQNTIDQKNKYLEGALPEYKNKRKRKKNRPKSQTK